MTAAATYDLGKLHGGLRLPGEKEASTARQVQTAAVPSLLFIPLTQHVGEAAQPVIDIGDVVLKGQMIATAYGTLSAPIHAPTSGKVVAIEPWPVSQRNGETGPCIALESDGEDRAFRYENRPLHYESIAPDELLQAILDGGIVGLGGAVFRQRKS
jgi:electron transport complex protein RnfC